MLLIFIERFNTLPKSLSHTKKAPTDFHSSDKNYIWARPVFALSVVVATRGRHKSLATLLASLSLDKISPKIQVVIVEDGPPYIDRKDIERYCKSGQLKIVQRDQRGGIGAARNTGIESADSDILAFLDDDCICCTDWIQAVHKAFSLWDRQVIGGIVLAADNGANLFSALRQNVYYLETFGAEYFHVKSLEALNDSSADVIIPYASGGNSAYRRRIFDRYGPFRNDLPAYVDVEMGSRLKGPDRPILNRAMVIIHQHPQTMSAFLRRSFTSGSAKGILCREGGTKHHQIGNWQQVANEVWSNFLRENFKRAGRLRDHGLCKVWWSLTLSEVTHVGGFIYGAAVGGKKS
jgi:GT2 family glycosyltransferase